MATKPRTDDERGFSEPAAFATERIPIRHADRSVAGAVAQFALGGLLALLILGLGALFALRSFGRDEAVNDAVRTTKFVGRSIVQPALPASIEQLGPTELAALQAAVDSRLKPAEVVRAKLWKPDGTIVYSDEPRLIGKRFELDTEDLAVIRTGRTSAGSTDLSAPENRFEPKHRETLQVYTRIRTASGEPLMFEAYFADRSVTRSGHVISGRLLPVALGALLVLALIQVPLAWALARRMRAGQAERERLLRQAIHSEHAERRRIAADLHDGIVQDLAGVSFLLAAAADDAGPDQTALRAELDGAAAATRRGIQQLRTLLVDIYPPNLQKAGLPRALQDLLAPVASAGIETSFDCPATLDLGPDDEGLVYRTAQEALRNVVRHSNARTVGLTVRDGGSTLVIRDDGRGFDPDAIRGVEDGHFGLGSLADLAAAAGATFDVESRAGEGTTVVLALSGAS